MIICFNENGVNKKKGTIIVCTGCIATEVYTVFNPLIGVKLL